MKNKTKHILYMVASGIGFIFWLIFLIIMVTVETEAIWAATIGIILFGGALLMSLLGFISHFYKLLEAQ